MVRPYRFIKFMKKNRTEQREFPVFKQQDTFNLDPQFKQFFKECIFEQQQDDDVDTDEEVLTCGINQCHIDLRDLKNFVKNNRHFRA
jgi:hypothetical protein